MSKMENENTPFRVIASKVKCLNASVSQFKVEIGKMNKNIIQINAVYKRQDLDSETQIDCGLKNGNISHLPSYIPEKQ